MGKDAAIRELNEQDEEQLNPTREHTIHLYFPCSVLLKQEEVNYLKSSRDYN